MSSRRRDLLSKLLRSSLVLTVAGLVAPICAFLTPLPDAELGSNLFEDADGNPIPPGCVSEGTGIVGRLAGRPTLVLRKDRRLFAFAAVCTHLGCVVRWNSSRGSIECPCHGGRFDLEGHVVGGPPPSGLQTVSVRVHEDRIQLA